MLHSAFSNGLRQFHLLINSHAIWLSFSFKALHALISDYQLKFCNHQLTDCAHQVGCTPQFEKPYSRHIVNVQYKVELGVFYTGSLNESPHPMHLSWKCPNIPESERNLCAHEIHNMGAVWKDTWYEESYQGRSRSIGKNRLFLKKKCYFLFLELSRYPFPGISNRKPPPSSFSKWQSEL